MGSFCLLVLVHITSTTELQILGLYYLVRAGIFLALGEQENGSLRNLWPSIFEDDFFHWDIEAFLWSGVVILSLPTINLNVGLFFLVLPIPAFFNHPCL